jgi:hypothetical protein
LGAKDPIEFRSLMSRSLINVGSRVTSNVLGLTPRQISRWLDRLPFEYPQNYPEVQDIRKNGGRSSVRDEQVNV